MAPALLSLPLIWAPIIILISASAVSAAHAGRFVVSFPAIFAFGDSLSDTGNGVLSGISLAQRTSELPYGETFPGWPARRFSDGHVLVDLLAIYLELPLLSPYLNTSADFKGGVNYATGGATALNISWLENLDIHPVTNLSLEVQLSWHLDLQAKAQASSSHIAGNPVASSFSEGLYFIEIGGNDHMYSYIANYSTSFVISDLIPMVIQQISNTVEALLSSGARHFVFMSITPLGCSPSVLATQNGTKDAFGCLEDYNYASYLHGLRLREAVQRLRASYPYATFAFMDLYGAFDYVFKQHELFGFSEVLKACCGAGDNYPNNFSFDEECSVASTSVCDNPNEYIQWDGIHFTDSFHEQIFNQTFLTGWYLDIDSLGPMASMKKRARDSRSGKFVPSPPKPVLKKTKAAKKLARTTDGNGNEANPAMSIASEPARREKKVRGKVGRPRTRPEKMEKERKVFELSITISVGGSDVDIQLLDHVHEFLVNESIAGKCSLERGGVAFHLHFQMVVRILSVSIVAMSKLLKKYLGWENSKPIGAVVICKALNQKGLHTFVDMLGYCMKDVEQDHFRTIDHNVSADDLTAGIEQLALHGQEEGKTKVMLTQRNFALKCQTWRRWKNSHPDWDSEFFKMLKSGKYFPCTSWIVGSFGRGYEQHRMQSYWRMLVMPTTITPEDVSNVFCRQDVHGFGGLSRNDWFCGRWAGPGDATNELHKGTVQIEHSKVAQVEEAENEAKSRLMDIKKDLDELNTMLVHTHMNKVRADVVSPSGEKNKEGKELEMYGKGNEGGIRWKDLPFQGEQGMCESKRQRSWSQKARKPE